MTPFSPFAPPRNDRPGNRQQWGQLHGSAAALALANAGAAHPGLTLVITADTSSALNLESELQFYAGGDDQLPVLHLPDWETLPYDTISPHQDIISGRLRTLYQLPRTRQGLLIVPVTTVLQRLLPRSYLHSKSLLLQKGEQLDLDGLRSTLEQAGYHCVGTVYEHGEFAVRGALIDIYPMGSDLPYRIELFDDEVETLRTFDPETQLTSEQVERIDLLPAREFPLDKAAIRAFKDRWHEQFDVDHRACPVYQDVSDALAPPGIEYYLPLFFEQCDTLFDYLPEDSQCFLLGDIPAAAEHFLQELHSRYENHRVDPQRPILPPGTIYLTQDELFGRLKSYPRTLLTTDPQPPGAGHSNFASTPPPALPVQAQSDAPLAELERFLGDYPGRVLFCADSPGRREALLELLARIQVRPAATDGWQQFLRDDVSPAITVAPLDRGLLLEDPPLALITEAQLFGDRVKQQRRRAQTPQQTDFTVRNLTELKIGAPVVHIDHGVGRYRGLQTITVEDQTNEFLTLEYAGDSKLYVPVTQLHLISRYNGSDEALAPLHRLGSDAWQKAKRKAAEQIRDTAAELLDIYARRAARKGHAFASPQEAYESFARGFAFEETPDQQQAIEAVVSDMLSDKPMDRLVCGDVGFGKTEVAMRAAFVATYGGKQVAVLTPTTLLAQQHYDSFRDRFADWPVRIEVLSRMRTTQEAEAVIRDLDAGKIDILIGTHKLLQTSIRFRDLGLLIVDEEHRFGVRQKERIKALRAEVDMLTLTATPIPRTLNMAMEGLRDLSIIATPPARRLSIKTFVRQHDKGIVKEAILRELLRGGQVYYLHNEVKSIERKAKEIQELVPEARVGIGHGQLRERELERVMSDFYHKRFNLLVCSTIIETGIDIPSANTIVIERADKFGLAQLHQLRGRVGRSHHQAYAYLLTPDKRAMTADAIKRLEAIAEAQDLGAGFTLATYDMEIRGTGELLGEEQSGQIQAIGFSLYLEMLNRAVKTLQSGGTLTDQEPPHGAEVNLRLPALIPEDYLPDVHGRLVMYKRLANAVDDAQLRELQVEMIDRFGLLPEPTKNLFRVTALKLQAEALGIAKIEAHARGGRIEFSGNTQVDPITLVKLVQSQPQRYRLEGANHLKFTEDMENNEQRLHTVAELIDALATKG